MREIVKPKKVVIISAPLLAGILLAGAVLAPFGAKNKPIPEAVNQKAVSSRTKLTRADNRPRPISQYLISSQALFSKAIAISQKKEAKTEENKNAKVIQLVNAAISQATAAALHYPLDPRGYAQRAKIYQGIEKYLPEARQTALGDWERAASLSRGDPQYFKNAGKLALKMNQPKRALGYWQKAAVIAPTDAQLVFDLARLESRLGRLVQAKRDYEQVRSILASPQQKELVEKELAGINALLSQSNAGGKKPQPTLASAKSSLNLPNRPPKLEANKGEEVIIAGENKKEDVVNESLADSNSFSGTATLPGGEKEITIKNSNLSVHSQVYLAAIGKTDNQVLRVKSKKACPGASEKEPCGYFVAALNQALNRDLEFKWWIIE